MCMSQGWVFLRLQQDVPSLSYQQDEPISHFQWKVRLYGGPCDYHSETMDFFILVFRDIVCIPLLLMTGDKLKTSIKALCTNDGILCEV